MLPWFIASTQVQVTSTSDPSGVAVELQRNARNDAYYFGQVHRGRYALDRVRGRALRRHRDRGRHLREPVGRRALRAGPRRCRRQVRGSALGDLRLTSDPDPCAGKTNCIPASNITDRDGRWAETQAQPTGEYRYQAVPQSDTETTRRHGYHDWGDSPIMRFAHTDDVTTTDAGTVEVLAPNLTGRVVDEDGRGVPGSDVWAERSDGTFHSHTIANEPDGAHGVFFGERRNQSTPDGTYVLTARAPLGCALLESEPVTVTYSGGTVSPSQVDLVLRRPPGWGDSPGEGWDVPVEADPDGTVNATVPTPAGEVTFDLQGVSGSGSLSASCVALPDELPVDAIDPPVDLGSTVDFEQATVCVPYTDAAVASAGLAESELALLHVDDADHVTDLTSQVDTSTNRICAVTPSFSRFLVGRAQDPAAHLSSGIHRWYGSNRFETAAAVSARSFEPGIPVAYLATGLTPDRIVVLGGPAVVSDQVVAQLGDHAPVTRRSGTDRYSTAAAVIAAAFPAQVETVVIATGDRYADALAGVPAAFRYSAPLIIVGENEIPETIADELERLSPRRILIFGGPNAVSTSVEQDLRSFVR